MSHSYTSLVTDKFAETVNFYEDHFGLTPSTEKEGYAFLQSPDRPENCVAVFDAAHECVAGQVKPVRGVILNFTSRNIDTMYDFLYMEGLEVYKEPGRDVHGRRHFVVQDPNGVLVNVYEPEMVDA